MSAVIAPVKGVRPTSDGTSTGNGRYHITTTERAALVAIMNDEAFDPGHVCNVYTVGRKEFQFLGYDLDTEEWTVRVTDPGEVTFLDGSRGRPAHVVRFEALR